MVALAQECKSLTHLDLLECYNVTNVAVKALIKHCPPLQYLGLLGTRVTDTGILAIAKGGLPSLRCLGIIDEFTWNNESSMVMSNSIHEMGIKRPVVSLQIKKFRGRGAKEEEEAHGV